MNTITENQIDIDVLPMKVEYVGNAGKKNPYPKNVVGWQQWEALYAKPKKPSNADILHSLIMDASACNDNFHDWCSNYGYSDDSIKAMNTYKSCLEIGTMLRKFLGADVVRQLEIQLQDY